MLRRLVLTAIVLAAPAAAQEGFDAGLCRGGMFGFDDASLDRLSLGRVGLRTARLQRDLDGCPGEPARCGAGRALQPGTPLVLLDRDMPGWRCALDLQGQGQSAGWLPGSAVLPPRPAAAVRAQDWSGTWRAGDAVIRLRPGPGGMLHAEGEAFWPGRHIPPAHSGSFGGEARADGDRLRFREDGCEVTLRLLRDAEGRRALAASDNGACGGHNVRFNGAYRRGGG